MVGTVLMRVQNDQTDCPALVVPGHDPDSDQRVTLPISPELRVSLQARDRAPKILPHLRIAR